MSTHLSIEAALFSTLLGGMPLAAHGQAPPPSGVPVSVWSSRDQAVSARMFPDLKSDPETEPSLQILNSFKHEMNSQSASEGLLVCEPEQSIPH
jgi:hypothetical protein